MHVYIRKLSSLVHSEALSHFSVLKTSSDEYALVPLTGLKIPLFSFLLLISMSEEREL